MPRVSVHIPCYNSEKYIAETLKSALSQTFTDFELIIINDGSMDRTEEIVKGFSDKRIRYFYQDNQGLAATRNKATSLSTGEFIAFLDHDDLWLENKLEKQLYIFDEDPGVALVYSNYYKLYPDGKKILALRRRQPEGAAFEHLLYRYTICLSTAIIRKEALDELGISFDEKLRIFEEYDVFMEILYRYKAAYLKEPLNIYRIHDNRSSYIFRKNYPDEYEYVIEKLKKSIPSLKDKYGAALKYIAANISNLRAKIAMYDLKDQKRARSYLHPYRYFKWKFFISYFLTFLPPLIYTKLYNFKNKRILF